MATISSQSGVAARRLDLGRVGEALFGLIQKDPVGTYGLAAGLTAIPAILTLILGLSGVNTALTRGPAAFARLSALGPWFLLSGLVGIIVSVIMYGALGWGAVQDLEGRKPTIGEKLSAAGSALLPMIGIAVLGYIGMIVGLILLIVPGLFLATMWSLVLVAAVIDRSGVFGSFSRSAALTRNNRWTVFLLIVIFFIGTVVVGMINLFLTRLGVAGGPTLALLIGTLAHIVIGGAVNVVGAVGAGVVYQELRTAKGEFDPSRLDRVFG